MTEVGIRGVNLLQDRMQKTQESLKDVDENIKKLTGRSPGESFRGGPRRGRGGPLGRAGGGPPMRGDRERDGRARLFDVARRSIGGPTGVISRDRDRDAVDRRRSTGQRFRRDSDDEDFGRPVGALSSSVAHSYVETPSREKSLQKQKTDRQGLARNKRMFGLLLGTLQKFKADTSQGDNVKKRQEIEEKLEQKAKEEKAEVIRQKQELWDTRRKKTRELKQLEMKLELVENHQHWEQETLKMKNFIRTETKPYIFWLPKDHVPETLRKHASSKKAIDALIAERKQEMEKDIEAILNEDHRDHDEEDHHEDEDEDKSPSKRRRHDSKPEGGDLDEAMKEADPDTTVDDAGASKVPDDKSKSEMEVTESMETKDTVNNEVKAEIKSELQESVTSELKVSEEGMDMSTLETEQMHLEASEALTGQPVPAAPVAQSVTVPEIVTETSESMGGEESMNTEENSAELPPASNHGEEQVVPDTEAGQS